MPDTAGSKCIRTAFKPAVRHLRASVITPMDLAFQSYHRTLSNLPARYSSLQGAADIIDMNPHCDFGGDLVAFRKGRDHRPVLRVDLRSAAGLQDRAELEGYGLRPQTVEDTLGRWILSQSGDFCMKNNVGKGIPNKILVGGERFKLR